MKGGNMQAMLKQVQQMQSKLQKMQEQMANETAEGQSGGGMVTAVVNGRNELVAIRLEKDAVDPNDVEMLQDLIVAAVNTATKNIQEKVNAEMSKVTGGIKIPGLM